MSDCAIFDCVITSMFKQLSRLGCEDDDNRLNSGG